MSSEALYGAPTLWELFARRAAASPDAPFLIEPVGDGHGADRTVTYAEAHDAAERRAAALHALGVDPGTVVSWQLPSRIDTVVTSLALTRLGAVQNPILHLYREREVRFAVAQLQPAVFLTAGNWGGFDYGAMTRDIVGELGLPTTIVDPVRLDDGDAAPLPPAPVDGHAVRWIYYTSGTTSDPKGVQHTDGTLLAGGEGLTKASGYTPHDVGSIAFPMAHIAGADYLVLLLVMGCSSTIVERFIPADAVSFFRTKGVTFVGGSTAFYSIYLDEQRRSDAPILPELRAMSGGGAPKPPALYYDVKEQLGVPILHGYGMTEVPMISMGRFEHTDEQLARTDGSPVDGAEVRIINGEICVRGPVVCKGYTDDALTAAAFDADGFFHTGDLGELRADGHLVVTGRLKDVIIRKGENISAGEIEDVLAAHPKVRDVAVIGLPDEERGERVCAVVDLHDGAAPLTFAEMVDTCKAAGLMTQKIPEQLEIMDELPRNDTLRKVIKQDLRARFGS